MISKIVNLLKKVFRPKVDTSVNTRQQFFYNENILYDTEYKKLMYDFFKTNPAMAEENYIMFYVYDVFIKAAINIILGYVLSNEFVYVNSNEEIQKEINELLKEIKIISLIEEITLTLLLFGYFCYYPEFINKRVIKFRRLTAKNISKIDEDYVYFRDNKIYRVDNFLVYKNNNLTPLGVSPLLGLIPYINNNLILLDALRFTTGRFLNPAILVGHTKNWSKNIRDDWVEQFRNLSTIGKIPLFFYNKEEIELDFYKPENIYKDYIELIQNYIEIIYLAFGIQAGLTTSTSGSYAKAKIQENMIENFSFKILKIILEEFKNKVIDVYIAMNFEDSFLNNETGEFRIKTLEED